MKQLKAQQAQQRLETELEMKTAEAKGELSSLVMHPISDPPITIVIVPATHYPLMEPILTTVTMSSVTAMAFFLGITVWYMSQLH